ncbi:MAG: hypothetical protein ACO30K_14590, partial [bacterium]
MKKLLMMGLVAMMSLTNAFAEELIVWSRGDWSDWMVEGFNKKMKAEGKDIVAVNNLIGHA